MDKLQLESPLLTMKLSNMKTSLYTINEENNAYFVQVYVYLVKAT